jgi:chemotaxis protein histidine kinase CheA
VTAPAEGDRSSALQQGTREFAGLYERHAYLVYNLALRITVDREGAIDAACAAFLASLSASDGDAELPRLTVRRALPTARQTPTPEAAGDAEAQAMLRATAELPPPERAVLALVGLASADIPAVAAALETTEEAAGSLIERAWTSFAGVARLPLDRAREAYASWLWAEPPGELWERLYPSFYAQLVRRVNAGPAQPDPVGAAAVAAVAAAAPRPRRRERRRARREERDARRARPPGRVRRAGRAIPLGRMVVMLVVLGAGAGVAYAAGLIGNSHRRTNNLALLVPTHKLTPQQIARLRKEEQQASREYAAQQKLAEKQAKAAQALQLKAMQQQQQQQQQAQIQAAKLAQKRRQDALKRAKQFAARQQALQAQLLAQAQQQQQAQQQAQLQQQQQQRTQRTTTTHQRTTTTQTSSTAPSSTQAQQQCLYNANNGTYVCPQH